MEDLKGLNVPQYNDNDQGDGLLRIQWRNGEQRVRTGGYFFVPADRLGDMVPGAPWEAYTDTFNDGSEVDGYKAEQLDMLIFCVRQQPFIWSAPAGSPGRYKIWGTRWQRGEANQGMQVEVLALVEGFGDEPVVWSSATIKTSFAIIGRGGKGEKPGIIASISEHLVRPAEKSGNVKLDTYCFLATVATEKDDKGKIVYTPTQGKAVTRPVLVLPETPDLEWVRMRYAGTANIRDTLIPLRQQYEDWRRERRTNDSEPSEPGETAAPNGRNVPEEVDDDLPF